MEIPSMNYLCEEFNGSSLPHQSHHFLSHVPLVDNKVSVKDDVGIPCVDDVNRVGHSGVSSWSQSKTKSVDLNSEADVFVNESNPSNSVSYPSLGGCGLRYLPENFNKGVVIFPDYVIYQDKYYLGLKLTFSKTHIQINYSSPFGNHEAFNIELAVDDLIDIKSQLFQSNRTVMMKLCVRSSNTSHISCTSGIEELNIAVVDSSWSQTLNKITSLNSKYSAVWKIVTEVGVEGNEYFSRRTTSYFPNFEVPFDKIVYPKGDPDAVFLSKSDADLLQPNTYINDTVIDFYIQYLKNKIPKEERSRFHFFNCFFFRKLADIDKDPYSACDGKAAFQRVRTWTRKINLFEKDYIFIPVNFSLHWSLLVICHPGEMVNFNDKEPEKSPRVPCILHMDSIKGFHGGLKNLMQSYLYEEWKERQKNMSGEDLSSRFLSMRFLSVAGPQQQNSYDCGLFLLHNLELFLAEAPLNFNPLKLSKFSNFLNLNWFQPVEAYLKRTEIQRLIFELVKNNGSDKSFLSDDSDSYCHVVKGESSTSHSSKGIEIDFNEQVAGILPQSSSSRGASICVPDDSDDDIQIIENFSGQNEARSLHEEEQGRENFASVEFKPDLWSLPDINASPVAAVNIPVYSFMEIAPISNTSYGENNLSCQEMPTMPFHQVSDAVDNNGRNDGLQIIDNMEPETCEEQATKKRRLLPLLGGSNAWFSSVESIVLE